MIDEFLALPLGARIYFYCIVFAILAIIIAAVAGFCGWSKVPDETTGQMRWKAQWSRKRS